MQAAQSPTCQGAGRGAMPASHGGDRRLQPRQRRGPGAVRGAEGPPAPRAGRPLSAVLKGCRRGRRAAPHRRLRLRGWRSGQLPAGLSTGERFTEPLSKFRWTPALVIT